MWPNPDLVKLTEEIFNRKLQFFVQWTGWESYLHSWNNLHFVLKKEIILELILESWKYCKYELTQS